MSPSTSIVWGGQQTFKLVGTELHEDTLRIESNNKKQEKLLKLILPTLCITYADMKFTNAIGGEQAPFPASQTYSQYFTTPITLNGSTEIEKYTWIRGAQSVMIGPRQTEISWWLGDTLVIPRLRLDTIEPTSALLSIPDVEINITEGLVIQVKQFADGRHIGGVRIEKHHPDWKPIEKPPFYDLWVHVLDAASLQPVPEARIKIFHWNAGLTTPYGNGGFELSSEHFTSTAGVVHETNRPSDELEAVTLARPGWAAVAHCFRPLAGQSVRLHIRTWKLKNDDRPVIWRARLNLEDLAQLTGFSASAILKHNKLSSIKQLKPGATLLLPCFAASYWFGPGETPEEIARAFAYRDVKELSRLGKGWARAGLDGSRPIRLPGWHFVYAREGDTLEGLNKLFQLPNGSCRTVGRVHHPHPQLPFTFELVAVPTKEFQRTHSRGKH